MPYFRLLDLCDHLRDFYKNKSCGIANDETGEKINKIAMWMKERRGDKTIGAVLRIIEPMFGIIYDAPDESLEIFEEYAKDLKAETR